MEAGMSHHSVMDDFDVFLNHRGPDVKATFVAHLDDALTCAGFRPFLDARSLMKGNPAFKSIDEALAMAHVHIALVSKGYAESKYCLKELAAMMRSGKPVIPVFYDVEPSDLRWVENSKGPFAEAFQKHKDKGRKEVQEWSDSLAALAEITGFCLANYKSDEAKLKREIVNEVARLTPSNDLVDVEYYRVGLGGPTTTCIQILDNMGVGTGILGLVGMGGIGKSTLAREIYNHFVAQKKFRRMTFLETHYDPSTSMVEAKVTWSRKLRKQILWDLLRVHDSTSNYKSWFRKISTLGPVFIVIDDVHKISQFEELVPFTSLVGPGSRVVVTSRDRSTLNNIAGRASNYCIFDVPTLGLDDSNSLFNWHTFRAQEAPEEYKSLAKNIVEACSGLPLALKVTGSNLFDKKSHEDRETIWPEAIDALSESMDVMSVLKWSYDSLPDLEKLMFLDITCQFYGKLAEEALGFWASCRHCASCDGIKTPHTALRNLIDKNLVIIGQHNPYLGYLMVHGVLRDLGQEIGRKAKSHFVDGITAGAIVAKNRGTKKIRGLNLAGSFKQKFEAKNFANMPNLHYLILPDGCSISGDLGWMSKELRWLEWRRMPYTCIPTELHLSEVTMLDFSQSTNLASLWTESNVSLEACPNLRRLTLTDCTSITMLPDSIGKSSRLEHLDLWGCKELQELPNSIGKLQALNNLQLGNCKSLKTLPNTMDTLPNLQHLLLNGCNSLFKLPPSIGLLTSLQYLEIEASTKFQTFPGRMGESWTALSRLKLENCDGLETLLDYNALKSLGTLTIRCSTMAMLPESFGLLTCLTHLSIEKCKSMKCLPNSIGDLKMLIHLTLSHCSGLERLPKTLGALTNLLGLVIECCPIKKLPKSTGLLSRLRSLDIKGCKNFQKLPTSINQLNDLGHFHIDDCGNIEAIGALTALQGLQMWGSTSITKLPDSLGIVSNLLVEDMVDGHYSRLMRAAHVGIGISQVLEEDQSGYLEAYQNRLTGVTSLLRVPPRKTITQNTQSDSDYITMIRRVSVI